MNINGYYDIVKFFVGELPQEFSFVYPIVTVVVVVVAIMTIFSPFLILWRLYKS